MEEAHALKEVAKLYLWLAPEKVQLADHVSHVVTEHAGDKRKHEADTEPKDESATEGDQPQHVSKKAKADSQTNSRACAGRDVARRSPTAAAVCVCV